MCNILRTIPGLYSKCFAQVIPSYCVPGTVLIQLGGEILTLLNCDIRYYVLPHTADKGTKFQNGEW